MNRTYYLYRHIRLDKNEPFYIGIGTVAKRSEFSTSKISYYSRAYNKERSVLWKRIVSKTEYEIEILMESDDYDFIKQKEIEFIALYGRINLGTGTLANLTDGGEGVKGVIMSEENKKKMSERFSGEKNPMFGKVHPPELLAQIAANRPKKYGKDNKASKPVINTLSLEEYECSSDAAKALNYNPKQFRRWMLGTRKNPTYCVYLEDYKGEIHEPEKVFLNKIKVINLETNEVYNSIAQASTFFKESEYSIRKKLYGKASNDTPLMFLSQYLDRKLM